MSIKLRQLTEMDSEYAEELEAFFKEDGIGKAEYLEMTVEEFLEFCAKKVEEVLSICLKKQ